MITHVSAAPTTMTKLFWKILCDIILPVSWTHWSNPSRPCFLLICQKKQNKTKTSPLKSDFLVCGVKSQSLGINLHCIQPVDFCPVIK